MPPRLKTLEAQAIAAGGAFAFAEDEYETRYAPPARPGRLVAGLIAIAGLLAALAHHLGWTGVFASLVASLGTSLGGWRAMG